MATNDRIIPLRHYGRWVSGIILLGLLGLIVRAFLVGQIDWSVVREFFFSTALLKGLASTILITACSMQMLQGRAQASALSPEALGWANVQQKGAFVAVGPLLESNPYGIAFGKENTKLRDAVYAALQKVFADGVYLAILKKWGAETGALQRPLLNGEAVN